MELTSDDIVRAQEIIGTVKWNTSLEDVKVTWIRWLNVSEMTIFAQNKNLGAYRAG